MNDLDAKMGQEFAKLEQEMTILAQEFQSPIEIQL
jgi:hypothetical protein